MKFKEVLCFIQTWWPLLIGAGVYLYSESLRTKSLTQYYETSQHRRAKTPAVPTRWLQKDPTGLILGKVGKRYFCLPEGTSDTDCMSAVIWGGSGSGKTSGPIGSSILQLQEDLTNDPQNAWTAMVCDLKGEISQLAGGTTKTCTDPNDADPTTFYLIDPLEENRTFSVGWDPYFRLRQEPHPSSDLRIEVFSGIAKCFIPEDRSQPYFSENAQSMFCGFLSYGFEHEEELVDTVRKLLTCNIAEELEQEVNSSEAGSLTLYFLAKFIGKDSEGFEDITSTLTSKLSCFALDSVSWILRDNPHRIGPEAVRRKCVFLSVPDRYLTETQLAPVFRLILSQEMQYLTLKLPPKDFRPIVLMIDEAYVIGGPGGIPDLEKILSICRGYRFSIVLAFQGQAQLDAVYGAKSDAGSRIILDNCRCRCVLEVTDKKSADTCVSWTGKFVERKLSIQTSRKLSGSVTWEKQDIFTPADFTKLVEQQKVLVVTPTGFSLIQKQQWFREKHFQRIFDHLHSSGEATKKGGIEK